MDENEKMDEAMLKKIIFLTMERDALDHIVFEQSFQKKVFGGFKELSKNQPLVIKIIGMEGETMISNIVKYTGMENSSLTHMVDDLEKKGMVFRKNDPKDRRKVLVSLTDRGLKCCEYINKHVDETLKLVDKKDVDEYLQGLETIVRILKKIAYRLD